MSGQLMLIDGHSLVYRGFYALQETRPLTNARGELTTGVFAFTSMLLKALEDLKPTHLAAAFDMSRPKFRLAEFPAYKGNRTKSPQGLSDQVTWSRKVLEAMVVPMYEAEGYEADDVIGTLTRQAVDQGLDVIILSGDNDLLQLVNPHVQVLTSRRGISDTILYDVDKVIEKYNGLRPDQVRDFKAIRGDATDNIPGVAGIGDKGASKLLVEAGSVEQLYEQLDKVPQKQRDLLEPLHDQVMLAKRLTTIVCDVPVELDVERARLRDLRRPEVVAIFQELSFKSLLDRLPKPEPAPARNGRAQPGLFETLDPEAAAARPIEVVGRTVSTLSDLNSLVADIRGHGSLRVQRAGHRRAAHAGRPCRASASRQATRPRTCPSATASAISSRLNEVLERAAAGVRGRLDRQASPQRQVPHRAAGAPRGSRARARLRHDGRGVPARERPTRVRLARPGVGQAGGAAAVGPGAAGDGSQGDSDVGSAD